MGKAVTDEKIKISLFYMASLKASRSDGFHAYFFQSKWEHIDNFVFGWVKKIFDREIIDPSLNNTLIVLLPKVHGLENFSQFRPINLCFVIYKLVMKVIANPFKVVFPNIIAPEQARFITGHNIIDNIIIEQEVIHSMRSK